MSNNIPSQEKSGSVGARSVRESGEPCHGWRFVYGTEEFPSVTFRNDSRTFKHSARANDFTLPTLGNVLVRPARTFRPKFDGTQYAVLVTFVVTPLKEGEKRHPENDMIVTCETCQSEFDARIMGYASLLPGLNPGLTEDEVPDVTRLQIVAAFQQGHSGPVARDPDTGTYIVPVRNWEKVTKEPIELGKEYRFNVRIGLSGQMCAMPPRQFAQVAQTKALALRDETSASSEFYRCMVLSPRGRWIHVLDALELIAPAGSSQDERRREIDQRMATVTEEEVRKAFKKLSFNRHPDRQESTETVVREKMLALYEGMQQFRQQAREKMLEWIKERGDAKPVVKSDGKRGSGPFIIVKRAAKPEGDKPPRRERSEKRRKKGGKNHRKPKAPKAAAVAPVVEAAVPEAPPLAETVQQPEVASLPQVEAVTEAEPQLPLSPDQPGNKELDEKVEAAARILAAAKGHAFDDLKKGMQRQYKRQAAAGIRQAKQ